MSRVVYHLACFNSLSTHSLNKARFSHYRTRRLNRNLILIPAEKRHGKLIKMPIYFLLMKLQSSSARPAWQNNFDFSRLCEIGYSYIHVNNQSFLKMDIHFPMLHTVR